MHPKLNEPHLKHTPEGWYVEIITLDGVASAGPMSKSKAHEILADVQNDLSLLAPERRIERSGGSMEHITLTIDDLPLLPSDQ